MDMGAMMKAMAWKVKYRRTFQTAGNTVSYKTRISWDRLGVHKDNRGSLFPQVNTLKDLANAIFTMGFCLEEADHMGVSVETEDGDVEPHQWNQQHVTGVDELQPCFPLEAVIDRLFLTHTHLGVVVKAFTAAAPWHLEPATVGPDSYMALCDANGNLSLDALANHPNGAEFGPLVSLGYCCEVLAAKIQTEEPSACRVIAAAYNMKNEVALQATELQALECLTSEISARTSSALSAEVSFNSVKASVMAELNILASDPDLIELFDLIVGLGARHASYLAGFMRFGSKFVNQKLRRMRLSGYKVVNEIDDDFPKSKVAVLKFFYKGMPHNGYVSNPSPHWGTAEKWKMQALEQALHYFHVTCKASIEALPNLYQQDLFIASVDTTMVGALDKIIKKTTKLSEVHLALATAAHKKRLDLQTKINILRKRSAADEKVWLHEPAEECGWLQSTVLDTANPTTIVDEVATPATEPTAKVMRFDETTGQIQTTQNRFRIDEKVKEDKQWENAPWTEWYKGELGQKIARAAQVQNIAFNILQMLHGTLAIADAPVFVQYCAASKKTRLVTSRDVREGEVFIPVWVSDMKHLKESSDSHEKVPIRVSVKKPSGEAAKAATPASAHRTPFDDDEEDPGTIVYAIPDICLPQHNVGENAQTWVYSEATRLHPFWLASHLTEEAERNGPDKVNCEYVEVAFNALSLGTWSSACVGDTHEVVIPALTNSVSLVKGTQLYVQAQARCDKKHETKLQGYKTKLKSHNETESKKRKTAEATAGKGSGRKSRETVALL